MYWQWGGGTYDRRWSEPLIKLIGLIKLIFISVNHVNQLNQRFRQSAVVAPLPQKIPLHLFHFSRRLGIQP